MSLHRNHRGSHKNAKAKARNAERRAQRRAAAEARVARWRALTPKEQLAQLPAGGAKKQRERILRRIEELEAA